MLAALACMALYIVLLGVAALLEQPIVRGLDAFQLDALLRSGAAALAVAVLFILLMVRGPALPGWSASFEGVGIGLLSGAGSLCYCLSLTRLRSDIAACLANGYLVVTIVLGVVVLHEPLTVFIIGGLALTVGGAILLSLPGDKTPAAGDIPPAGGSRFAHIASPASPSRPASSTLAPAASTSTAASPVPAASGKRLLGLAWLAGYVVLVVLGAFLEKPALRRVAPLQLNALVALGMATVGLIVAGIAHADRQHSRNGLLGARGMRLPALGVGVMIGAGSVFYYLALAHLPVSIAAAIANSYVLVTVMLAVLIFRQALTWRTGSGVATILVGVVLLTLHAPL